MKTKNGVELNLKESEYRYSYLGFVFYFSSEFYMNKFTNEVEDFIHFEEIKINNKYKIPIKLDFYLALSLYKKIEKRGFYVLFKGKIIDDKKQFKINEFIL